MKHRSIFRVTNGLMGVNDLMHAVVIGGALILTALSLSDELFNFRGEHVIAVVAYVIAVAAVTYAAVLAQPSLAAVRAALMRRRAELATISL